MNLRTLKKLSKRAAPLLAVLGDHREQFPAARWDSYTSILIGDRKHWDRSGCHPTYEGRNGWLGGNGAEIVYVTRAGCSVVVRPPSHPRKGTVMVGAMSGYYEPEWNEETAWEALQRLVYDHFTDWSEEGAMSTRLIDTPSEVFAAAADIIAEGEIA